MVRLSLSGRLSLFVALIVTAVVSGAAYLEVRSLERDIERDLADTARLAAQSAVEGLSTREPPLDPRDLRDMLHDLVDADPALDTMSIVEQDASGLRRIFTST